MRYLIGATLTALFLTMTIQADAQTVEFNFRSTEGNGVAGASLAESNFDPSVAGDTINVEGLVVTVVDITAPEYDVCLLYTSPSPRDLSTSRMPSSA